MVSVSNHVDLLVSVEAVEFMRSTCVCMCITLEYMWIHVDFLSTPRELQGSNTAPIRSQESPFGILKFAPPVASESVRLPLIRPYIYVREAREPA